MGFRWGDFDDSLVDCLRASNFVSSPWPPPPPPPPPPPWGKGSRLLGNSLD
ncbi:hypothetical protein K0M31_013926 [Melipona bicolor]|uniref:Uncharacterized protein n=1 Tax=Melipona bicolor TaxID=60889 RepID=A0AA40G7L0_9HYME|nr:hypothetical protein K0M31_013926 [Melipona bicolor]